jgi:aspartyl-tRNA synthetase
MTDKFIQAWCEEHGFSNKVAAVIAYKEIEEKDLNIDNYSEDSEEIIVDNESYTVYNESDVYNMIKDEQDYIKDEIKNLIHRYIDYDVSDYIDFKEYFNDNEVDISNVIDEDRFTEFCFNNYYYYICDNDQC